MLFFFLLGLAFKRKSKLPLNYSSLTMNKCVILFAHLILLMFFFFDAIISPVQQSIWPDDMVLCCECRQGFRIIHWSVTYLLKGRFAHSLFPLCFGRGERGISCHRDFGFKGSCRTCGFLIIDMHTLSCLLSFLFCFSFVKNVLYETLQLSVILMTNFLHVYMRKWSLEGCS